MIDLRPFYWKTDDEDGEPMLVVNAIPILICWLIAGAIVLACRRFL